VDNKNKTPEELAIEYHKIAEQFLNLYRSPEDERVAEDIIMPAGVSTDGDLLAQVDMWAHKALEIYEAMDGLAGETWKTYNLLVQVAEVRGDVAEAQNWRRKERAGYIAFPGHWARLATQWGPALAAVVAAAHGDPTARAAVETGFAPWESHGWQVSAAFQRIWEGERDWEALTEGLNNQSALIVYKALEALELVAGQGEEDIENDVDPAVQGMSPLVAAVVACCEGEDAARDEVGMALSDLASRNEWRGLSDALRCVLEGERDRDALVAGLDEVDTELLDLTLGTLAGDMAMRERLASLTQAALDKAEKRAQAVQEAFAAWLETPPGQAAMREVQAQGLEDEPALTALLERFASAQS